MPVNARRAATKEKGVPLRLLQVGMGAFGRSWASDVVSEVKDVCLVGCVDVDPASLAKARAVTHLPADRYFLSLDKALQSTDADAVLVTTILPAHIPVTMAALEAGKHVLVEKPFAPTLEAARLAIDAAAARGLVLQVSQNYRFFPAVRAIQKLVESAELGRVDCVYVDFRRYDNRAPRGEYLHFLVPQPMLVDMAIHHFDLMRAILHAEPRRVHCHSWNPPFSKFDEPPEAVATITFEGDIVVSYRGSWISPAMPTPWAGHWRMEFAEAEVSWTSREGGTSPDSADLVSIYPLDGEPRELPLPRVTYTGRAGSLDAFARAIRTGEEPETSGRDNIHTLAFTIATVESAASSLPVDL